MASFNRVLLLGNMTRDPQLRYLPSQMAIVEFGLAMNRRYKTSSGEDREEVCFVECTAWGKQAEVINQYCQKGRPIFIEGHLKFDTWEDKQGGGKRSKLSVVVDGFQLLGGRPEGAGGPPQQQGDEGGMVPQRPQQRGYAPRQNAPQQQQQQQAPEQPFPPEGGIKEEDIPF